MKNNRPPVWLFRTRNIVITLLVLIAIVVASRRMLTLGGIIKPYVNPKFGAFDSGFVVYPFLTFLHIIPGVLFLVLTPFQFSKKLRGRNIQIHRVMGWIVASCAFIIGITALVMSFNMAIGGVIETAATVTFALYFLFALFKAVYHIKQKQVSIHRKWMIRMFAIGLAIATVRPIIGLFFGFSNLGPHQFFGYAFWIGFTLHAIIAEIYIRRYKWV
ncbi:DUF2306 domain-containing protein [Mucilaginibacter sp. UYCu711]|uniref:DUF2306 domain-containing protein n=1 Tax=Mucilaginibacter sp. UYCu711 TaxID=3156339 RepID=UPI003D198CE7